MPPEGGATLRAHGRRPLAARRSPAQPGGRLRGLGRPPVTCVRPSFQELNLRHVEHAAWPGERQISDGQRQTTTAAMVHGAEGFELMAVPRASASHLARSGAESSGVRACDPRSLARRAAGRKAHAMKVTHGHTRLDFAVGSHVAMGCLTWLELQVGRNEARKRGLACCCGPRRL